MSEIGFKIQMLPQSLTAEQTEELRRHYLVYAKAERDEGRDLHRDLDRIYTEVDKLAEEGKLLRLVTSLHESKHTVIFATDASMLSCASSSRPCSQKAGSCASSPSPRLR
jgi:hypothetical protein